MPVLAVWWREDGIIPLSSMDRLTRINGNARHKVIAGAGHGLTYTHTAELLRALRDLRLISPAPEPIDA